MAKYSDSNFRHVKIDYDQFVKTTKRKALDILMNNLSFDEDGCWIWTGEVNIKGTGVISVNCKRFSIKKIAYLCLIGDFPRGKAIYNKCQKQLCFNPEHFELHDAGFNYDYFKNRDSEFIANVCQDSEAGVKDYKLAFWYDRSYYTIRLITMDYKAKLRDPRWQKKRLQVFERDKWTCTYEGCGDKNSELHVHHTKYLAGVEPWDVPLKFLRTLCKKHHELVHRIRRNRKRN